RRDASQQSTLSSLQGGRTSMGLASSSILPPSGGREPGLTGRRPVVEAVQPDGVVADGAGEALYRAYVIGVVVVPVDGAVHVPGAAHGPQVAGGSLDRVPRAHDVAAVAVVGPGAGHELHGAHGAGAGGAVDAAEVALDEVDRGQEGPVDRVL